MNWKKTNNRFIAYFDIMGFKNRVQQSTHGETLALMEKFASYVKSMDSSKFENIKTDTTIRTTIFSDSIIIISNSNSIHTAANIMLHSAFLIRHALELGIPIRGCLSYGKFTADFEKSVFFGQPLIDSYLLEEELQMYSVVLHHSFESFIDGKKYGGKIFPENGRIVKYLTVFKNGKSSHYHLNWPKYLSKFADGKEDVKYRAHISFFYKTISGPTRAFVDNTIAFYDDCLRESQNKL